MKGGIYMIIFFLKNRYKKVLQVLISVFLAMLVFVISIFDSTEVQANENLKMYAKSYALTDGDTNRVLLGKNETVPMANASTTKILTCILTLETCSLDESVTITEHAASQPKVRLGVREGEQYPLRDMLYGLMLESYNDCAVAIAEHVAGSEEGFSDMLNQKAIELGCKDTYFLTPNGLDKENAYGFHHTTAEDLCKMMAYCVWESPMKDVFLQITQTRNYSGEANDKSYSFTNRNAFLDQMEGVLSGKTGYTAKAGYCYVAAYENNGERYCISLLACGWPNHKTYKWSDSRTLFTYGSSHYDKKRVEIKGVETTLEIEGYTVPPEFLSLNQKQNVSISGEDRRYDVLLSDSEQVKKEIVLQKNIKLPITQGQTLGVCRIYIENMLLDEIELLAIKNIKAWNLKDVFEVILCQFLTFSS